MLSQHTEMKADQMFRIMSRLFIHFLDATARNNVSCLKIIQIHSGTDCFLLCFTALYLQVLILLSFLKLRTLDLPSCLLQHLAQCSINFKRYAIDYHSEGISTQVQTHCLTEAKNRYAQNRDCEEYGT